MALDCAVEGLSGIVIELASRTTREIQRYDFNPVEVDSFFYDPRSFRADFSDARYMGEASGWTSRRRRNCFRTMPRSWRRVVGQVERTILQS